VWIGDGLIVWYHILEHKRFQNAVGEANLNIQVCPIRLMDATLAGGNQSVRYGLGLDSLGTGDRFNTICQCAHLM
jgi:ribonuclease HIII